MKKRLLITGALIMAAVAVFSLGRIRSGPEDGVLVVSGNVEVVETNLGFPVPGRVNKLFVEDGQSVRQGDRLAVLDNAEAESQVIRGRASLEENLARLADLKAGARPQELAQSQSQVEQAEAELTKAKKDRGRATVLFSSGAISAQQMDAAERAFDVAAAGRRKAGEALNLLREGPRQEEVRAAENRVAQARALLRAAEERLRDTVVIAPVSGVVLRKNAEPGETAAAGMPVYTIGDLGRPWIKVYVKEDKLGLVRLGQKAVVLTDSFPGKQYKGTVSFISSEAEFTPKNVQTEEERVKLVFGVKVSVENVNDELKPGMPADVRIALK